MEARSNLRCILYHRTSSAHPEGALERGVERLRRHTIDRDWQVERVVVDRQKRPRDPRPGFESLAVSKPKAVLVLTLDRLFVGLPATLAHMTEWLQRPTHIVAIDDGFDTTKPQVHDSWLSVLSRLRLTSHQQKSEAATAAAVEKARAGLAERKAWDVLAVVRLYREGLSQRVMARRLSSPGHNVAQSSLNGMLQALKSNGTLGLADEIERDNAQACHAAKAKRSEGESP